MKNDLWVRVTMVVAGFGLTLAACGAGASTPPAASSDPNAAVQGPSSPSGKIPYAVSGVVSNADGHPVADVAVLPVSLDEPAHPVPELPIRSDAVGRYAWPSLSPGRYELQARGPAGTGSVQVTVRAGITVTGDLTLRPAG